MKEEEVARIFERYWKPGWASITKNEALFIQEVIAQYRPKSLIEIGMASGISAGLIACMMEENGGESLVSIDHQDRFFGDPSKEMGFLVDEIYSGTKVKVERISFRIGPDIPSFDRKFDMAFVDANHQHPWPTIDTLCLYPFLKGPRIVLHHDLNLYQRPNFHFGIGPKFIHDQFSSDRRIKGEDSNLSIFAINLDMGKREFEQAIIDGLHLPWSLQDPISQEHLEGVRRLIGEYYSPRMLKAFDAAHARYRSSDWRARVPKLWLRAGRRVGRVFAGAKVRLRVR